MVCRCAAATTRNLNANISVCLNSHLSWEFKHFLQFHRALHPYGPRKRPLWSSLGLTPETLWEEKKIIKKSKSTFEVSGCSLQRPDHSAGPNMLHLNSPATGLRVTPPVHGTHTLILNSNHQSGHQAHRRQWGLSTSLILALQSKHSPSDSRSCSHMTQGVL